MSEQQIFVRYSNLWVNIRSIVRELERPINVAQLVIHIAMDKAM